MHGNGSSSSGAQPPVWDSADGAAQHAALDRVPPLDRAQSAKRRRRRDNNNAGDDGEAGEYADGEASERSGSDSGGRSESFS